MNLVLLATIVLAVAFIAQGIHVIVNGRIAPRFGKLHQPERLLQYPQRLAVAALYLAVGIGLMGLVVSLIPNGLRSFSLRHLFDVLFAMMMLGLMIVSILRPVVILRWARRAHPELEEDNQAALLTARLVGIVGLCIVLFFLLILARSF